MRTSDSIAAIGKKINAIMQEVTFIPKDGTNDFHKYKYASEYAIKCELHKALSTHGLMFQIIGTTFQTEQVTNAKGNRETLTTVVLDYKFTDTETGEFIVGQGIGQGQDPGDKGAYKAITGALKYILTTSFLIPTGDDPEADNGTDTRAASQPQKPEKKEKTPPPAPQPNADIVSQFRNKWGELPEKKRNDLSYCAQFLPLVTRWEDIKNQSEADLRTAIDRLSEVLKEGK